MRVLYHPEFSKDIQRFEMDCRAVSDGLAARFRDQVQTALEAVKGSPQGAGHFLQTGSTVVREFRRRNLRQFPFFILYGVTEAALIFGSVIPTRSDPLTWLVWFGAK